LVGSAPAQEILLKLRQLRSLLLNNRIQRSVVPLLLTGLHQLGCLHQGFGVAFSFQNKCSLQLRAQPFPEFVPDPGDAEVPMRSART
jgi:hypothetical protein